MNTAETQLNPKEVLHAQVSEILEGTEFKVWFVRGKMIRVEVHEGNEKGNNYIIVHPIEDNQYPYTKAWNYGEKQISGVATSQEQFVQVVITFFNGV